MSKILKCLLFLLVGLALISGSCYLFWLCTETGDPGVFVKQRVPGRFHYQGGLFSVILLGLTLGGLSICGAFLELFEEIP